MRHGTPDLLKHAIARTALVLAVTTLAAALGATPAHADSVGVSGLVYTDDAEVDRKERIANQGVRNDEEDLTNAKLFAGGLYYMFDRSDKVRLGGGARFYGSYAVFDELFGGQERGENEEPTVLGPWLDLYGQLERIVPASKELDLDLVVGAQFGLSTIFVGGVLEEEVESLRGQNVRANKLPRLGFMFGPQVGVRYTLAELVSLRLDSSVRYHRVSLFNIRQNVDDVSYRQQWQYNVLRYELALSAEVQF